MIPRGIRNNNPGNIRLSNTVWQGSEPGSDPAFVRFQTMALGVRAMAKILLSYYHIYDLNTVHKIIARWAPPNENDTGAYVAAVAHDCGLNADAAFSPTNSKLLQDLCRAIIHHENGPVPPDSGYPSTGWASDTDLALGVNCALGTIAVSRLLPQQSKPA